MNNEFKKSQDKDQTVYTLESATSGGTSSGSIASVSTPLGGMQRRNPPGDNILAQEAGKDKVDASKPRNFVAKNAKMGGAGAHKDKKKEQKQGAEKHKKPYMEALKQKIEDLKSKLNEAQAEKKPHPETWHDVDPKLGRAVDKMSQAEKVKKGYAHPDTLKQKGVAEGFTGTYVLNVMDEATGEHWAIEIQASSPAIAKERARQQGYKVLRIKEKGVAEGFNSEYDDEAGMAQSNLLTTARAVMGLLKTIKDRDNLPEWGQEKIAKAEMMLVSVWDYLQSQKEMGNDPQQDMEEGAGVPFRGVGGAFNRGDDERHDLDPTDWYFVKDGKMFAISVYPNQEREATARGYSRTRDAAKAKASQQGVAESDPYMESLNVMLERSVSQAQHNLMVGVAHNPQFAQKVKVKQQVGQEFAKADVGRDISKLPVRVPKKK